MITVAICTYRRPQLLRETLDSFARLNAPAQGWELLVIDNNSGDESPCVVEEFAHLTPRPRYVLETQQGLDHARNRAVQEAVGEILVLADDDILASKDWLIHLTAPFLNDPEHRIASVGGTVIPVFPEGYPAWMKDWAWPLKHGEVSALLPEGKYPMGANLAFRGEVFERVGLFHTGLDRSGKNLFSGGETDMIRRLRKAGYEVWFAPEASVEHQFPRSRMNFGYAARHAFDSARSRVLDRVHNHPEDRWSYLFSRALLHGLKGVGLLLLALVLGAMVQIGASKRALVRAWRCAGYVKQAWECVWKT